MELFGVWGIIFMAFIVFVITVNADRFQRKTDVELAIISFGLVLAGGLTFYIADTLQILNLFAIVPGFTLFLVGVFLLIATLFRSKKTT